MDITLPLTNFDDDTTDATYLPSFEAARMHTRLQTQKEWRSSCALTERYWEFWKTSYLTALREQHRCNMDNRRGCNRQPKIGDVVLIADACEKRNNWKLGRIVHLEQSSDGAAREAEVFCGKGNPIRRPVNQLIPLELSSESEEDQGDTEKDGEKKKNDAEPDVLRVPNSRYNLRPRDSNKSSKTNHETPSTGRSRVFATYSY
ncbi:unnamed protein product [Nippostrongylus brasiliensis]|uniref:DUF5641 domain-containing protein n=1 Tax=Nippostrongylus brasiliensis TaxID=27835 RepID=A0A0N4YJA6_NIPBR|nr:unnamed protein product [Nippostrongylus brasiliensis]